MLYPEDKNEIAAMIKEAIERAMGFSVRKVGDTPNDAYQLTPRKYVTANGSVAGRPTSSVAAVGQFYLSTNVSNGQPMWFCPDGQWRNGAGSVVAGIL